MIRTLLREICGLLACLAILYPLIWWALKVFFGD